MATPLIFDFLTALTSDLDGISVVVIENSGKVAPVDKSPQIQIFIDSAQFNPWSSSGGTELSTGVFGTNTYTVGYRICANSANDLFNIEMFLKQKLCNAMKYGYTIANIRTTFEDPDQGTAKAVRTAVGSFDIEIDVLEQKRLVLTAPTWGGLASLDFKNYSTGTVGSVAIVSSSLYPSGSIWL